MGGGHSADRGKPRPVGYLAWAACGKDPGFSPASLLAEASRTGRYTQAELDELAFEGSPPDARVLGAQWHRMLAEAQAIAPERIVSVRICRTGLCSSIRDTSEGSGRRSRPSDRRRIDDGPNSRYLRPSGGGVRVGGQSELGGVRLQSFTPATGPSPLSPSP